MEDKGRVVSKPKILIENLFFYHIFMRVKRDESNLCKNICTIFD